MYDVSTEARAALDANFRSFAARMTFLSGGGGAIGDIITSVRISNGSVGGDTFKAGAAFLGSAEITLGEQPAASVVDREFRLEIGILVDDAYVWIPMGIFAADNSKVTKTKYTQTIEAWDRLARRGKDVYVPGIAFPATVGDILADIRTQTGLRIVDSSARYGRWGVLPDLEEEELTDAQIEGKTVAEVLGFIAGIHGGFAWTNRSGFVRLDVLPSCDISDVTRSVSADECKSEIRIAENAQVVDDGLYDDYTYYPYEISFVGDPTIDPIDTLALVTSDETRYAIAPMSISHAYDGGITTSMSAPSEKEEDKQGPIARRLGLIEIQATEAKQAAESAQQAAQDAATVANGKSKVYFSASVPTGTFNAGDCWYDTDDDNTLYMWDGSQWSKKAFGHNAIAARSIYADQMYVNALSAVAANMGEITAGQMHSSDYLAAQSGVYTARGMIVDLDNKIIATPNFAIVNGKLYAVNGEFTGKVTADTGQIANFKIKNGILVGDDGAGVTLIDAPNNLATALEPSDIYVGYLDDNGSTTYPMVRMIRQMENGVCRGRMTLGYYNTATNQYASMMIELNGETGQILSYGDIRTRGKLQTSGADTTTSAANTTLDPTGWIQRYVSSSRRYKQHVKAVDDAEKLLELPVVYFQYKEGYLPETDQRHEKTIPGFYAEDVAEVYPIACDYDGARPEDWNAKIMIPPMLKLIQEQHAKIEQLSARLDILEQKAK